MSVKEEQYRALTGRLSHIGFRPPKTYERVGDVLIIPLPEKWSAHEEEIGQAYMEVFGAHAVMSKGVIRGEFRLPSSRKIAGSSTITTHKENGILYKLDVATLMYSAGNIGERMRMAHLPKKESVIDMFAGIGYFSLPIAKFCTSKVVALEKNPESFSYLCENVRLNDLCEYVEPINIDCRDYEGHADRVIMGYFGAYEYLPHAFSFIKKGYILYHDAVPEKILERPIEQLREEAKREHREIEIIDSRKIKQFSPGVWHVCAEALLYP